MKDSRRAYLAALDAQWPEMAAEFRKAIRTASGNVDYAALVAAIEAQDIEAALKAMSVTEAVLAGLQLKINEAYTTGGQRSFDAIVSQTKRKPVGRRVIGSFNPGNPAASKWMQEAGAKLITLIADGARDTVRSVISEALLKGHGPDTPATTIAGRVVDGRRKGGLVGLTDQDIGYMREMRAALRHPEGPGAYRSNSGKPKFWIGRDGKLKSAWRSRNKRFDGMIKRALGAGIPVGADDTARTLDGFRNKLLKARAENIGRTEIAAAQTAGQRQAYQQMIDDGQISNVSYEWDSAGDSRTRPSHDAADGHRVKHGEPFTVGGYKMFGPSDASLGAPPEETNRCRCWARPVVDFFADLN